MGATSRRCGIFAAGTVAVLGALSACDSFGSADESEPTPDVADGASPVDTGVGSPDAALPDGANASDARADVDADTRRCNGAPSWFCDEFTTLGGAWQADLISGDAAVAASATATSPPNVLRIDTPVDSRAWLSRSTLTSKTSLRCTFDVALKNTANAPIVLGEIRLEGNAAGGPWYYAVNLSANGSTAWTVGGGSEADAAPPAAATGSSTPLTTTPVTVTLSLRVGAGAEIRTRIGPTPFQQDMPSLGGFTSVTTAWVGFGAFAYAGTGGPWAIEFDDAECVLE